MHGLLRHDKNYADNITYVNQEGAEGPPVNPPSQPEGSGTPPVLLLPVCLVRGISACQIVEHLYFLHQKSHSKHFRARSPGNASNLASPG